MSHGKCFISVDGFLKLVRGDLKLPKDTTMLFNVFNVYEDYQTIEYKKLLSTVPPENILLDAPPAVNKNYISYGPRNKLVVYRPLEKWLES